MKPGQGLDSNSRNSQELKMPERRSKTAPPQLKHPIWDPLPSEELEWKAKRSFPARSSQRRPPAYPLNRSNSQLEARFSHEIVRCGQLASLSETSPEEMSETREMKL